MKPLTSAPSAGPSSTTSRRRSTRNRHNLSMKNQMKNQMKNHPVVVGPKVLLVGQVDRLGTLADLPVDQVGHLGASAGLLVGLRVLPVGQAGPPEGAEDDGQRKA
jgi:hypothetical protein